MKASEGSSTARWRPRSPASSTAPSPERFALAGPSCRPDPRIHAYRPDVADIALAARVFAPHYARAETGWVAGGAVDLRAGPSAEARAVSQLLHGEGFAVLDVTGGWAWGRCLHDDYVGYLPAASLAPLPAATHRVTTALAPVFAAPDIKAPIAASWSLGACFAADGGTEAFVRCAEGFVHRRHAGEVEAVEDDPVAIALRLLGQPYRWGGRGAGGIDCSGLVQLALGACGTPAPRDSDLQRALGEGVAAGAPLQRGDLVFTPGHVGLMADAERLLHANAYWMAVTLEPLAAMLARQPSPAFIARRIAS